MKQNYYVSRIEQSNGDHEVHDQRCTFLPSLGNRLYLGEFESCREAINSAREIYSGVDGCKFCSPTCHKG
ncbi:MAG TPA: hypothetical protein VM802_15125 [Chitinophaga sp.]|uniref:hypothetical protein n=1 Tax=Chitinophaga sp. TaxID=1869181 RepID=UPI002CAA3916|nr:hypothetical protein [Chitinophaga sp.]HVI46206.1 hypothetical protein [Chitinophaga sp.]